MGGANTGGGAREAPPPQVSCATRYLEFCVNTLKNSDKAIHNFLISCYAKSDKSRDHEKLLEYLTSQATFVSVKGGVSADLCTLRGLLCVSENGSI